MINPTLKYEHLLWRQNYHHVAGIDEVGRGCWAGPVIAAAVSLNTEFSWPDTSDLKLIVRDSKIMSVAQRNTAAAYIQNHPHITFAIGQASVKEINQLGIAPATFLAMQRAIDQLQLVDYCLIDGFKHPSLTLPQQAIIKGDAHCLSIAMASIVAKQFRDQLMSGLSVEYPDYQLHQHKGYGTKMHQQAIMSHGLTDIHRTGFRLKFLT